MRFATTAAAVLAIAGSAATARADDALQVAAAHEVSEARLAIHGTVAQMRATSLRVRDQLRTTRKRGTRAQIACVDEALSRTDVGVRRARDTGDDALAAYARGDVPTARALLRRVAELRVAQGLAAAEGASCTPGAVQASASAPTTVKLEIDPKIPPTRPEVVFSK